MASDRSNHTFGKKCRLAPVSHASGSDGLPAVEAQFFYSSLIPIDDPLSASSITTTDSKTGKAPLRPFGCGDNNVLEKAWLGLQSAEDQRDHEAAKQGRKRTPDTAKESFEKRDLVVQSLALKHWELHRTGFKPQDVAMPIETGTALATETTCCAALILDVSEELEKTFCALSREFDQSLHPEAVLADVLAAVELLRRSETKEPAETSVDRPVDAPSKRLSANAFPSSPPDPSNTLRNKIDGRSVAIHARQPADFVKESVGRPRSGSQLTNHSTRTQTPVGSPAPTRPIPVDDGITGKPFARAGDGEERSPQAATFPSHVEGAVQEGLHDSSPGHVEPMHDRQNEAIKMVEAVKANKYGKESVEIAVGVSRLHMVSLPTLQMKPIYWSPVNDVAVVMRATWFYRDTMMPVPPSVANQLEAGYDELKPWTDVWHEEVKCAIEVGSLGEEKVAHQLWPKPVTRKTAQRKGSRRDLSLRPAISSDPFCAARCFHGEAAAEGSIDPSKPGNEDGSEQPIRPFSNYTVLYKNEREAFMLKPSLAPSSYYGRKPLSKIVRGITVGIPVVRGFDRPKWERLHEKKKGPAAPGVSAAQESHESQGGDVCPACKAEKDRGQVTDLVLVAHGIGQKFAERVESFHFTHAINGFRRAVNIELGSPLVQQVVREGQNGLMILPLNWRMGLSFEDGGPLQAEDEAKHTNDGFGLKDIEPSTIPAVRSMISDVMFDIPFYMSHHKGKMIKALVSEANRVYRLWCRNNPGFAENGRVHMIGHSLGSAMALEVLSRQPSIVPELDLSKPEPETTFFEFDTKNLFLVGSPAGFFLLLERGALMPRRGRRKPGADSADTTADGVVGEEGTFGCLAVDNIYNILAKEDPIAYLLNGAVDPGYASSLKTAHVPSSATTFFKAIGNSFRSVIPGMGPAPDPLAPDTSGRPPTMRLPSQLELEVHDFTREEIAEKKAYLLNDNGQIDWYLRSGGGPLEIQYLNMMYAHTSYWANQDFIRMLCIEIGRKPGKAHTLPAMRAVKNSKRVVP